MPGALPVGSAPRASATDFLIASKRSEIHNLEAFLRMSQLVVSISNLVHALQRERGGSNLYLGSGGTRYGERLMVMVADADQRIDRVHGALAELNKETGADSGHSRLYSRIAYAVHALSEINVLRNRVKGLQLTPESALKIYSELIQGLLAVVFEAADTAMDPTISRILVAMFNFMQGKELAGQERAVGAAGFAMGKFDTILSNRMCHLEEGQAHCFQLFTEFADEALRLAWETVCASPDQAELDRLRRAARASADHPTSSADEDLADRWFWLATARIDAMKAVEDRLERRLQALCEEKITEAREGLKKHQSLIKDLLEHEDETPDSFIVFCSSTSARVQNSEHYADQLNGRFGQSVIELVQYQSQRLQKMSDELAAARAALEERKLLDRAKGLLMTHRNMSEEEAYRLLRQTAMNQSRRLADVARAMIAVGDVWARPTSSQK